MALRAVPDHPKFADLKRRLGVSRYVALGVLEALWHFTGRFTPQGNVGKYSDEQIEAWIEWNGEPGRLISCLVDSRWLDVDTKHRLLVHDWAQHADKAAKQSLLRSKLTFCSPTVDTGRTHDARIGHAVTASWGLPVPEPVPEPEPAPEPVECVRPLPDPKPATMQSEAPWEFVDFWRIWSAVRGTAKQHQALQAWLSVVNGSGDAVIACARSYLDSLENPAKGYNPDNFIFEQARDGFAARWPKFQRRETAEEKRERRLRERYPDEEEA